MDEDRKPRVPNAEEIEQLTVYVLEEQTDVPVSEEVEEARGLVEQAYIAVFDHYMTSSPGYAGKVMVLVWDGGPDLCEMFLWRGDELVRVGIYREA